MTMCVCVFDELKLDCIPVLHEARTCPQTLNGNQYK